MIKLIGDVYNTELAFIPGNYIPYITNSSITKYRLVNKQDNSEYGFNTMHMYLQ
jgi:hypothetical protein